MLEVHLEGSAKKLVWNKSQRDCIDARESQKKADLTNNCVNTRLDREKWLINLRLLHLNKSETERLRRILLSANKKSATMIDKGPIDVI